MVSLGEPLTVNGTLLPFGSVRARSVGLTITVVVNPRVSVGLAALVTRSVELLPVSGTTTRLTGDALSVGLVRSVFEASSVLA